MLLDNLITDILQFNESNPTDSKNKIENKKEYRGNQHDLDTYLNTVRYMEYQKNIRKNVRKTKVIGEENTFNSVEDIQSHLEKNQFKKKWSRLDTYLKKIKLKEFVDVQVESGKILLSNKDSTYKNLLNLLQDKKLNKKNEISYDEVNGKIIKIFCLKDH
tara:strand:+ start:4655 stop:5134 length:480 start_codon:yes stop_codon:yes gene_type:complete